MNGGFRVGCVGFEVLGGIYLGGWGEVVRKMRNIKKAWGFGEVGERGVIRGSSVVLTLK